jgi:hypothetical protein
MQRQSSELLGVVGYISEGHNCVVLSGIDLLLFSRVRSCDQSDANVDVSVIDGRPASLRGTIFDFQRWF